MKWNGNSDGQWDLKKLSREGGRKKRDSKGENVVIGF